MGKKKRDDALFSKEELAILRKIIEKYEEREVAHVQAEQDIMFSLANMGLQDRKNKTYSLATNVVDELDGFCKERNIKMSNVVELAIVELLKKYKVDPTDIAT